MDEVGHQDGGVEGERAGRRHLSHQVQVVPVVFVIKDHRATVDAPLRDMHQHPAARGGQDEALADAKRRGDRIPLGIAHPAIEKRMQGLEECADAASSLWARASIA